MTYLLDLSTLLALLWETHEFNERVTRWQENQSLAVCPITELGFLRISTQPSFGLSPAEARRLLGEWKNATAGFYSLRLDCFGRGRAAEQRQNHGFLSGQPGCQTWLGMGHIGCRRQTSGVISYSAMNLELKHFPNPARCRKSRAGRSLAAPVSPPEIIFVASLCERRH